MNREEIRKKWKNKEFVEITNSKPNLSSNERNYVKPISNDMWSNVMNRANQILNTTTNIRNNELVSVNKHIIQSNKDSKRLTVNEAKNVKSDVVRVAKGAGLGAANGLISASGQSEFLTQQRSDRYRKFNELQTDVENQKQLKTAQDNLNYNIQKLDKSKTTNGIRITPKSNINDSKTMKMFNEKQNEINQKIIENSESSNTKIGKYLSSEVAPSMGQSLVGTALDIVAPGMGSAYRMLSYSGNYTQDGLNKGMNENQAAMYGLVMGGVESAMDAIGDKLKSKAIGESIKSKVLKDIIKTSTKELGINMFFEGSGEALTEPLQEVIAKVYGGKADYDNMLERMGQSFLAGAISELLMTGTSLGYGNSINAYNKIQNGEQITTKEITSALKEIQEREEVDIEKILKDNLNFAQENLIQENQNQINKQTDNKLNNIAEQLSTDEIKKITGFNKFKKQDLINNSGLSDFQKQKLEEVAQKYDLSEKDIQDLIDNTKNGKYTENQVTTMQNNEILQSNQQVMQQDNKTAQNKMSQEILGNGKYQVKMPNSNYIFTKSGNANVDNLRQDANKYWNNSKDTQKLITTLEKIMTDKNISIRLDDSITDGQGNVLDGRYENGTITINPNSSKAIEYVATHELTHAIGTKDMLNIVQKYRESNAEFNSKVETLLKNYEMSELTEEALADVSAELFGTQEFISNVQNKNPNLFQKIYNEIKYLWHQLKGYKNESQFIDDLYNKWTKAYNSDKELNQTTKNLNIGLKGFKNAEKNIDRILDKETLEKYRSLQNSVKKAVKMAIQGKSAKEILKATNGKWTKNTVNNQVIFNISDKDIDFQKRLQRNSSYTLGEIIRHDELFFCYPELLNLKVMTKDFKDADSARYYDGKSFSKSKIEIQNRDISNKQKILQDLVHEIQHAVQRIEGTLTAKGYSDKDIKYLNNILEIEAEDQAYRYKNNIENNFTEVSKEKPQHPDMKLKSTLEKIPIEAYNLFIGYKGVINQNENNKRFLQNDNRVNRSSTSDTTGKDSRRERNRNFYRHTTEEQTKGNYEEKKTTDGLEESSSFSMQKDNNGRTLSKEQQEYFKDSKVRDENGNLLEIYHKTGEEFNVFDKTKIGKTGTWFGKGFYFTDDLNYFDNNDIKGDIIKKVYLKMENPLILTDNFERVLTEENIKNIVNKIDEDKFDDDWLAYKYKINKNDSIEIKREKVVDYLINNLEKIETDADVLNELSPNWFSVEEFGKVFKETTGYDGVIKYKTNGSEYVVFEPNQIKNVDNTNPTENPDIRYSRQGNIEWYDYVEKQFKTEGTRTYKEDVRLPEQKQVNLPTIDNTQEKSKYTPTTKSMNYERKQRNIFKKNMSNMLGISQFNQNNKALFDVALNQLKSEYNQRGSVSEEVRNDIFNNLYNNLLKEDRAFYDENKEIKDNIRTTKLYVDNKTKTSIVDYDDFRKSTMGSAILTNDDTNMPIDSYYKELNELNPGLFPDNITNTADQLQRIVEVSKSIRKSERNIAEYADEYMSKEYRQYAKQEFDLYVNQLLKEYKIIDRYNQDKIAQNQKEDYVAPDLQEIRTFYENRNALQKEIEKQERNLLLTQREKAVVDRLLKDEMDVNEILPGLNKDAILKSYTARQQLDYLKQEIKKYKSNVKQNLKDIADSLIIDAENWKDKSWGGFYSRETATRNMQDIMSRDSADRINKELFEPIIHNTAEQTRFLNEYTDIINKLNLDKKEKYDWRDSANKPIKIDEATVAQLLIEKKISDEYLKSNNMNVERIHNIADTFEKLLKDTVNRMDDVYVRFGYAPVEKRKNYFPHFLENQPDTFMSKFANAFGFKVGQDDLPTDIAGRTETFKPGRAFDRNILQRTTDKTDYNALKALDMYMQGASDIIYHTEDIQKLRAFNESIRDRFRTSEIQKKLDAINENVELTEEERFSERQKILEGQKTPLNNLVTWIDEYTNVLANKKSSADRQLEKDTSRQAYTTMKDIEGKISSNLIGGNFSVALTNFAPLSQAMGTTKVGDILIGMIQTTQNSIDEMIKGQGDGFVNESDFLTSRRGNDLAQKERLSQQLSNVVSKPMEIIDNFTSEAIVRAKYRENIKNGMDHNEALKNADNYARNLMADRSKGAMPIYFNRTNPATKLISAFQIEPNNIISNYFKDMPRDAKINKQNLAFQITKLSVASYAFNTILKSIRGGGDVIPNPIGIVSQLIELAMSNLDDDDDNDKEVKEVLGNIANDILGNIPGGSALASLGVALGVDELQDNGKLMVSSAMPDFTKVANLFDSSVSNDYKKQVIANELTKPLLYLGLPTGGAQLSKTAKGLYSYVQGASYSYDKDGNKSIQFPVEQTPKNLVQSSIFGKYATDSGKEYVKEFNGMNYKETAVYDKSNIDFNKLKDYFNYSKTKGITKSDKFEYIKTNMANISTEDKWNLFEYNILSSDERDDGTSQVTDAEYAIKNKMATQKEYMNLYEKAEKNNIEFPNGEKLKELKENNLELETYIKYKINLKQEGIQKEKQFENQQKSMLPISEEDRIKSKSLNNTDKINIIKHKIYTEEEKDKIYINEIGKDDDVYTSLKLLNNGGTDRINDYLDYKTADLSSDKKDDGTLKGKTISGSAEAKFKKYIYNSNFRDIEKTYLYGTKYKLDSSQRSALENYIKELDITSEEKNNIYKSLASSNIVEMKDGTIKWKN